MEKGVIIHWNDVKKFGFIKVQDHMHEEFFFHMHESFYRDIVVGDKVSFNIVKSINKPGTLIAVDINKII